MAVPFKGIDLTTPPTGGSDNFFELVATAGGFAATYTRLVPNPDPPFLPTIGTYVRLFDANGKGGKEVLLGKSGGQETEVIDIGGGKLMAVWPGGGNLQAAVIDAKSGKVIKTADLGINSGDNVMEIAALGGGKVALVATSTDASNPFNLRLKTSAYVLDAGLKPKKGAQLQDLPLSFNSVTVDHWQVVDRGAGAAAVWLDRADNLVYAQFLNAAGAAAGKRLVVSPDKLELPSFFDTLFRSVKAASTPDGGFVVSWSGKTAKSDGYDVWARVYDKNGKAGAAFRVNEATAQTQVNPEVTVLDKGRFAVTWAEAIVDGFNSRNSELIRIFDGKGKALTGDITLKDLPPALGSPPRNTEWVKLTDGSLVAAYAEAGVIKAYGVPRIQIGTFKADKFGTAGDDIAVGNAGNDTFTAGAGTDSFTGGAGNDSYSAAGLHRNRANATFDGVEAKSRSDGTVTVTKPADGGGTDTLKDVESFTFTKFKDSIDFSAAAKGVTIHGDAGIDTIKGGSGQDFIFGDAGADLITASAGGDHLVFARGSGADKVFLFAQNPDTVLDISAYGRPSFDIVIKGATVTAAGDTVINLGGGSSITLVGVDKATLTEGDFII